MKQYFNKERLLSSLILFLKVTLSGVIATLIAFALKLENPTSAGIVAILSVLPTKKETFKTAMERTIAYLVALLLAFFCYSFGFTLWNFLLFLVFYLLFCSFFSFYPSMAMNAVLMAHFLSYQEMSWHYAGNDTLLFAIGAILGISVNLTLVPDSLKYRKQSAKMDEDIKSVLFSLSQEIREGKKNEDTSLLFSRVSQDIMKAKQTAMYNRLNSFRSNPKEEEYVLMREKQYQILSSMVILSSRLKTKVNTSKQVSAYVHHVAMDYHQDNDARELLSGLQVLRKEMEGTPLPTDREEFEQRARLFYLFDLFEDFLIIKNEYSQKQIVNKEKTAGN